MVFPCYQRLLDGWRYLSPRHGKECVEVTPCLRLLPHLIWILSPHKQHSHPRLCRFCRPFLSIPLCVQGPDLVQGAESFRPPSLPGHFLGRGFHYKSFEGPELWDPYEGSDLGSSWQSLLTQRKPCCLYQLASTMGEMACNHQPAFLLVSDLG